MSIFLGEATLQGDSVVIVPPAGSFGGVSAVRLTNYTGDALILTNMFSDRPGDEYLMPFQQMVYPQENVKQPPRVRALTLGAGFSTQQLLVEWSTEPEVDFPGTYPVSLTQAALTGGLAAPAWEVHNISVPNDGTTTQIAADTRRVSLTIINIGAVSVQYAYADSGWGARPQIAPGSGRTIDTTAAVYFRPVGADSEVQWLETRFGPGIVT